ncbi:uncharacterized protein LOC127129673 [Lathyrus oleraceus]|uniref:uncharacterized protein LOC127129673 n=1 Tax=Pisum sativum TaxID=3888 RepID=UPI0021CDF09A|nr:uncharacterized protein LOC127129673 [Pisum sativum]
MKKFGLENSSHKRTHAPTHLKLSKDEKGISVYQSLYRRMIGSLLYLTASRPDITFVVGVCARYQVEPKVNHISQVKRNLKDVNGTRDYGMLYSHDSNSILVGYCDADWASSADEKKITYEGCFFLGNNLISWFTKKLNCVSISTAEDEYIKQSSPKHMHVPTETSGSSSRTVRANEPFQMINLDDLVLDVSPLSPIHPPPQKKATPFVSKNVKTTETSPDNDSSEKVEESVPEHAALERRSKKKVDECIFEHAAHERRSKKKANHDVNVDELTSDKEPLTNIVTPGIAKRLQRRKRKAMVFEDSPSKEIKRKFGGLKSTPSRSSIGKSHIGPTRSWSKVVTPTRKRKVVSFSDSEFEVEKDVQDITHVKRSATKKPHASVPEVPLENVSLHYMKNVERCKYVISKEGSFGEGIGLVKEFMVTIPDGCDDVKSADYRKVYVRGNVVTFSPTIDNKFLGRIEEPQDELEVTYDQVCKEIFAKQVRHWLNKGKLSAGKLSVKYDILHRIGTAN